MKGEIFNIFEKFVVSASDQKTFHEIYDQALPQLSTSEPYVGPGTYPDSDLLVLAGIAIERLRLQTAQAMFAFGKFSFPHLAAKIPEHSKQFSHPKPFLLTVHNVIHVEVRKILRDAVLPVFLYDDYAPHRLRMTYISKRKLYDFAEGLIVGCGDYYGTRIEVAREISSTAGEEACIFDLSFESS